MKYILDTHALIWFLEGNSRLGVTAKEILADSSSELVLPAIALIVGVNWGVLGVAVAVFLTHSIASPAYTVWVSSYISKVMDKEIIAIEAKEAKSI